MLAGYTYQPGQLPYQRIPLGDLEKIIGALNSIIDLDGVLS